MRCQQGCLFAAANNVFQIARGRKQIQGVRVQYHRRMNLHRAGQYVAGDIGLAEAGPDHQCAEILSVQQFFYAAYHHFGLEIIHGRSVPQHSDQHPACTQF